MFSSMNECVLTFDIFERPTEYIDEKMIFCENLDPIFPREKRLPEIQLSVAYQD